MFSKNFWSTVLVLVISLFLTLAIFSESKAQDNNFNIHADTIEEDVDTRSYPGIGRPGDIDGEGSVTVSDAIIVLRHVVGLIDIAEDMEPYALERAKVSRGGEGLSVSDAILILRYVVGLIEEFPAENPWDIDENKTVVIEPPGGEVDLTDGNRLNFPGNALKETAEITLERILPDEPVEEEGTVSSFYSLKGFPVDINEPVELTVPLEGEIHGETFIVWSEELLGYSEHSGNLGRQLLPAEVDEEEGVARAIIEPVEPDSSGDYSVQSGNSDREIIYHALSGQATLKSRNGNFATTFPAYLVGDDFAAVIENINDAMEDAYDFIDDTVGMSFEGGREVIPVSVFKFKNTYMGGYRGESAWGYAETEKLNRRSRDYISINERMLGHPDATNQLRATAAHELFHLFQYLYVKPPYTNWGNDSVGWLREASSVWLEFQMINDENFWPAILGNHSYYFPLNGLLLPHDSATGDADQHGYASSIFLRYVTEKKGNAAIGRLWNALREGDSDRNAFAAAFNDVLWYRDWLEFSRDYFTGKYLPSVGIHAWSLNSLCMVDPLKWTVDDPFENNTHEIKMSYPPLSTRVFEVELQYGEREFESGEDGRLVVTTDESIRLAILRKSGYGDVDFLGYTHHPDQPFELPNLGLRGPETLIVMAAADYLGYGGVDSVEATIKLEITDLPELVFTNPEPGGLLQTDNEDNITVRGRFETGAYANPSSLIEDLKLFRYTRYNDGPPELARPTKIPVEIGSWQIDNDGNFTAYANIPEAESVYALLGVMEFEDETAIKGVVFLGSPDEWHYTSEGETIRWSVDGLNRIFPYGGDDGNIYTYELPPEDQFPETVTIKADLTAALWESAMTYKLEVNVRQYGAEEIRDDEADEYIWNGSGDTHGQDFSIRFNRAYRRNDQYLIAYVAHPHDTGEYKLLYLFLNPAPRWEKEDIIDAYLEDMEPEPEPEN